MKPSEIIFKYNKNGKKTAYQRFYMRQQRIGLELAETLIATGQARESKFWL